MSRVDNTVPLCVDLDGSLIASDTLLQSMLGLLRRGWLFILWLPLWLLRGRAAFKARIADHFVPDASLLPYRPDLLSWLEAQRAAGRSLVLCTGANHAVAEAVARHLSMFDAVIASDGTNNLTGSRKLARLVDEYGARGYDYVGNEARDLKVWAQSRRAIVVGPERLAQQAAELCPVEQRFGDQSRNWAQWLKLWLRGIRLHQWLKNLLIFVPAAAGHVIDLPHATTLLAAFVAFGLCASATYVINDLLDLEADRAHPRKRLRPFASAELSMQSGIAAAGIGLILAAGIAMLVGPRFALVLGVYLLLTLAYSLGLKQKVLVDVMALAALYTLRIIAGGEAAHIEVSFWLLAFSMFLFLSLALVKRCAELEVMLSVSRVHAAGRGYSVGDLVLLQQLGIASGYAAVLVLALYVNSPASQLLYEHPRRLWLLCPILLYWISRTWFITHRGNMHDDPLLFAIRDRISRVLLATSAVVILLAT